MVKNIMYMTMKKERNMKPKTSNAARKANLHNMNTYDPLKLKVRRFIALVIDWYIVNVLAAVPVTFWLNAGEKINPKSFDLATYGMEKGLIYGVIVMIICVLYYVLIPCFVWQGQTPGKKICGIRIIRVDGNEVGLKEMIFREILGSGIIEGGFCATGTYFRQLIGLFVTSAITPLKYISYGLTVASMVVAFFDKKGQAIHDKLAQTIIIRKI